jgi:hypothetical protein
MLQSFAIFKQLFSLDRLPTRIAEYDGFRVYLVPHDEQIQFLQAKTADSLPIVIAVWRLSEPAFTGFE